MVQQQQQIPPSSRRTGTSIGEIVQVQGGHIVRSTGRKDRHSKVCTAKGPRDRRVRLSAHTAIQFYDVQDRLGYDRPSKAVDWLIKKAKPAIDELAELPAWKPSLDSQLPKQTQEYHERIDLAKAYDDNSIGLFDNVAGSGSGSGSGPGPSTKRAMTEVQVHSSNENETASFLPPSLESDSIADTIKSFFPMGSSTPPNNQFQSFQDPHLLSRTNSQAQDLRLSLQFQDPILVQEHNRREQQQQQQQHQGLVQAQAQAPATAPALFGFDSSGWSMQQAEPVRVHRLGSWSDNRDTGPAGSSGGYMFNSPPLLQQLLGQSQFFSQRGPLQSSNTPSVRAWMDPSATAIASADHHHHHQPVLHPMHPSSIPGYGFASQVGGFSGFRIPARIQGEEEEHDGISDKPSSASSDSRH